MTREEAIYELQEDKRLYETEVCHAGDGSPDGRLLEALDMAIEALQAEAVHKPDYSYEAGMVRRLKEALTDRPTGEWIHQAIITVQGEKPRHEWSCSICGLWGNPDMNYCPNCGADMRGE